MLCIVELIQSMPASFKSDRVSLRCGGAACLPAYVTVCGKFSLTLSHTLSLTLSPSILASATLHPAPMCAWWAVLPREIWTRRPAVGTLQSVVDLVGNPSKAKLLAVQVCNEDRCVPTLAPASGAWVTQSTDTQRWEVRTRRGRG